MNPGDFQRRLCEISTHWTAVVQAPRASTSAADAAHAELFQRYGGAVFRYLLGAVRDLDAAEELSHEFVLRLVRGDFHRVAPQRGRFRDYIKTVLINLVNDYYRSLKNQPRALESAAPDPAAPDLNEPVGNSRFEELWRQELLERT